MSAERDVRTGHLQALTTPRAAMPPPSPSELWSPPNWVLNWGQLGQGSRPPAPASLNPPMAAARPSTPPPASGSPPNPREGPCGKWGGRTYLRTSSLSPPAPAQAPPRNPNFGLESPRPAGPRAAFIPGVVGRASGKRPMGGRLVGGCSQRGGAGRPDSAALP